MRRSDVLARLRMAMPLAILPACCAAPAAFAQSSVTIYGRLNIGHGPNTDELLRHLGDLVPGVPTTRVIEFDLHYLDINERRLERMWLDLIFETPQMNSVRIRDLFLSRHLRADM